MIACILQTNSVLGKLPREETEGIVTRSRAYRCQLAIMSKLVGLLIARARHLEFGLSHSDFAFTYVIYLLPRGAVGLNRIRLSYHQ